MDGTLAILRHSLCLVLDLCFELLVQFLRKLGSHLALLFFRLLGLAQFDPPSHAFRDELARPVHQHPLGESKLGLALRLQLQSVVVEGVELLSVLFYDAFASGQRRSLEHVVLCIHQNVHILKDELLVYDFLHALSCPLTRFTTVDGSEVLLLRRLLGIVRILCDISLQEGLKNSIAHSLQNRRIFSVCERVQEGLQQRCQVGQTNLRIHLIQLRHKHINNLEQQTLCRLWVLEPLLQQSTIPLDVTCCIICLLKYRVYCGENVTDKHEVLVDSEIVDLVPVLIENVQAGLQPQPLVTAPGWR